MEQVTDKLFSVQYKNRSLCKNKCHISLISPKTTNGRACVEHSDKLHSDKVRLTLLVKTLALFAKIY